jgi:RNA polymerase sigma-70 factor (ECF subfamily)
MNQADLRGQLKENHSAAWGWALSCCRGDKDMAEEVLHDAYIQVLEGRARFSGHSAFRTWLFAVIRNMASKRRYRISRRVRLLKEGLGWVENNPVQADVQLQQIELSKKITDLLETLSTRQRQVLHLIFYQELTVENAASVLGISVGSARTHYHRGKVRLRREMDKAGLKNG